MRKLIVILSFFAIIVMNDAMAITISLVPSTQKIHPSENVFVDINVSGLQSGGTDTLLGAFQLDALYDPNLFNFLAIPPTSWGSGLGNVPGGEAVGNVDTSTPGVIHLTEVSLLEADSATCTFCTGPYLEDLQVDSFRLATIGLYAFNTFFVSSSTNIATGNITLSDAYGNEIAPVTHPEITISVSLPSTLLLFGIGLVGGFALKRKA